MRALESLERWPGRHAAAVLRRAGAGAEVVGRHGPCAERFAWASVTKLAASLAVLTDVAAGRCDLADAAGPEGATLAHLLAHASGLPLDGNRPIAPPGTRRIYSNTGMELAVAHAADVEGCSPGELVRRRVFEPLGMSTSIEGSVASGGVGSLEDLCRLCAELLCPTLLPAALFARATSVAFEGLDGVLPGFGPQRPCDFGLGPEVKGTKDPHWSGRTWPGHSFGHFGQRGGFLLVDGIAGIGVVTLGDEPFGPWSIAQWPPFTDLVRSDVLGSADTKDD